MPAQQLRSTPPSTFSESRAAFALGSAILLGALIAAYANSFRVPFLLDDTIAITDNPTIRSISSAWLPPATSGVTTSGRPLLNISLAANYAIHGTNVFGYHVVNLLIHFLGALTLWAVVRRTLLQPVFASRFAAHATPLAWCAAALWALHPLQTESVTYIVQRAESLVGLFYLLTLYYFIRSVETPLNGKQPPRAWPILAIVACLAGMASKEVMASAPLIVFLYDRTFVSGSFAQSWRRHRAIHLSLAATWLLLLTCIIQSGGRGSTVGYAQVAWWEYAITQASAITGYLWRAIWPSNLIFDYGAIVEKTPAVVIPSCLFILILLSLAIYSQRRHPLAGFVFAWFFLILAPTSSVIPVATQTAAEHRMYLPLAAVAVPVVLLFYRWTPRFAFPAVTILLLAAGVRTHVRNHDYRSELALWKDTVARVTDNVRALNNLGAELFRSGHIEESTTYYRKALFHSPDHAESLHNLGCALLQLRHLSEAVESLEKAVALDPDNTLFLANLGHAYMETGEVEKALRTYRHAYELKPQDATCPFNLANTLMRLDRLEEAGRYFSEALALAPNDSGLLQNYAVWLRRNDRAPEAIPLLEKALRSFPNSGRLHSNLGTCLLQVGRIDDAIRELEIAVPLNPDLAQTRFNLGNAYAQNGRPMDAIPQFEALLKISAPTANLLNDLGTLYIEVERYTDALSAFQRALALDPQHLGARENLDRTQAIIRQQSTH